MIDNHEYYTYKLLDERFGYKPLKEERGRIPEIEQILDELAPLVAQGINKRGSFTKKGVIYYPSFETFFNEIQIPKINFQIIEEDENSNEDRCNDDALGHFKYGAIKWEDDKLDCIEIGLRIKCPLSRLLYNIRRGLAHELLHAYEFYNKKVKNVPQYSEESINDFYNRICKILKYDDDPANTMAWIFYYTFPKELRATSQEIQIDAKNIFEEDIFFFCHSNIPFDYYKSKMSSFSELTLLKKRYNNMLENYDESEIIQAMNYVTKRKYTTIHQVEKVLSSMLLNMEQIYIKALSRGIENCKIKHSGDSIRYSIKNHDKMRNRLNEIREIYGNNDE